MKFENHTHYYVVNQALEPITDFLSDKAKRSLVNHVTAYVIDMDMRGLDISHAFWTHRLDYHPLLSLFGKDFANVLNVAISDAYTPLYNKEN